MKRQSDTFLNAAARMLTICFVMAAVLVLNPPAQVSAVESKAECLDESGETANANAGETEQEETANANAGETDQEETVVTGLKHLYNPSASSSVSDSITVEPGNQRELRLQYYDTVRKKWATKSVYRTGSSEQANIRIKYPKQWKKKSDTRWRIYIPASEDGEEYTSEEIEIVTKNIASVKLSSKTAVIMRADNAKVLYGKKMHTRRENASTTKMMTAMIVLERNGLRDKVKMTRSAVSSVTYPKFKRGVGSRFYVNDLLQALLVRSSNDAAAALAQHTGGSIKGFSKLMNKKAKELGCKNTHFENPHGLNNPNHYSSAYDLALIQRENITNEHKDLYLSIIQQKSYSIRNTAKTKRFRENTTDKLLHMNIKGFKGGKTGLTTPAGNCFCGVYEYKGVTYIFTVLGSRTSDGRWNDCLKLMKYIRKYA